MDIQYSLKFGDDNLLILHSISIDISEDATINELFDKLHEATNIPRHKELTWGKESVKVSCSHFIQSTEDQGMLEGVDNLDEKISTFPKHGKNGALVIFIETNEGYVN